MYTNLTKTQKSSMTIATQIARDVQELNNFLGAAQVKNGNEFAFIPSTFEYLQFIQLIIEQYKIKKTDTITDLGCGVSPVLLYLYLQGFTTLHGVDTEERYLRKLKRYIGHDTLTATHATLDTVPEIVKDSKLIYLYMPIRDKDAYVKAIGKVCKQMKKGTIIMDMYGPLDEVMSKVTNFTKLTVQIPETWSKKAKQATYTANLHAYIKH